MQQVIFVSEEELKVDGHLTNIRMVSLQAGLCADGSAIWLTNNEFIQGRGHGTISQKKLSATGGS